MYPQREDNDVFWDGGKLIILRGELLHFEFGEACLSHYTVKPSICDWWVDFRKVCCSIDTNFVIIHHESCIL